MECSFLPYFKLHSNDSHPHYYCCCALAHKHKIPKLAYVEQHTQLDNDAVIIQNVKYCIMLAKKEGKRADQYSYVSTSLALCSLLFSGLPRFLVIVEFLHIFLFIVRICPIFSPF